MSPPKSDSHLEKRFENLWKSLAPDIPLEAQKKGIVPGRRYIYDFYCPPANVLFEINGGIFARGKSGHSSGLGIQRDYEKVNQAQLQGYDIFVMAPDFLVKDYMEEIIQYCREKANANQNQM